MTNRQPATSQLIDSASLHVDESKVESSSAGPYLEDVFSQAPSPALGKVLQPATDPV